MSPHALIDDFLRDWFQRRKHNGVPMLWSATEYSVFSGGKRFRPMLILESGRLAGVSQDRLLPFAAAVELVHTYSLIHDDLPVMDDDDWRRGRPTCHRVYGDDVALLAGDALLTEAFLILAEHYKDVPELGLRLTSELSLAAGPSGMVAGQVIDLRLLPDSPTEDDLLQLHSLKTGALIAVSVKGAGVLARWPEEKIRNLERFGALLGLAFQVADDILDNQFFTPESGGRLLKRLSDEAKQTALGIGPEFEALYSLVDWNCTRKN